MNRRTGSRVGSAPLQYTARRNVACGVAMVVSAVGLDACGERATEKHFDIPAPIAISQWADRVDTLAGTYTYPSVPVQFGDSMAVIADGQDKTIWKIDITKTTRVQLGTQGDGPGEYRHTGSPARIRGDSIVLLFGTASDPMPVISVATGRGRTHRIPLQSHASSTARVLERMSAPLVMWADTLGNVYGQGHMKPLKFDTVSGRRVPGPIEGLDTIPVVRYGFFTGRIDTVLQVPRGVKQIPTIHNPNGTTVSALDPGPYGAFNGWAAMLDGRVLYADAARYSVKVLSDSGAVISDWKIVSNAIAVSKTGWDAYVQKTTHGTSIELQKLQQETFAKIGVAVPNMPTKQYDVPPMPGTLPRLYFAEGARHMSAFGNVVWFPVHLSDPPGNAGWDVIDVTTGKRVMTISLPEKQSLVAVTNLGAYVVATDDDDLRRVLLYRSKKQ